MYDLPITDGPRISILFGYFMICTCGCVSQVTTAMLAVTRFLCIVNPFLGISHPGVLGYILIYSLIMTTLNLSTMFCKIFPAPPGLGRNLSRICLCLNVSQCLLGILASLFTVLKMLSRRRFMRVPDQRMRSTVTILLMNLPYLVSVVLILITLTGISGILFSQLTFPTVACFTSMLNPVTILLLNRRARHYTHATFLRKIHCLLAHVLDLDPLEEAHDRKTSSSVGFVMAEQKQFIKTDFVTLRNRASIEDSKNRPDTIEEETETGDSDGESVC